MFAKASREEGRESWGFTSLCVLHFVFDFIFPTFVFLSVEKRDSCCVFSTLFCCVFCTLFCCVFCCVFCELFCVLSTMLSAMFSTMLYRSCWAVSENSGCSMAVVMRQSAIQSAKSGTLDFRVCFWKLSQTLLLFFCQALLLFSPNLVTFSLRLDTFLNNLVTFLLNSVTFCQRLVIFFEV